MRRNPQSAFYRCVANNNPEPFSLSIRAQYPQIEVIADFQFAIADLVFAVRSLVFETM